MTCAHGYEIIFESQQLQIWQECKLWGYKNNFFCTTWFVSMCLHICVCVCVCVRVRRREGEGNRVLIRVRAHTKSWKPASTFNHGFTEWTCFKTTDVSKIQLFPSSCRAKLYLKNGNKDRKYMATQKLHETKELHETVFCFKYKKKHEADV
jgi:hypothetical protein